MESVPESGHQSYFLVFYAVRVVLKESSPSFLPRTSYFFVSSLLYLFSYVLSFFISLCMFPLSCPEFIFSIFLPALSRYSPFTLSPFPPVLAISLSLCISSRLFTVICTQQGPAEICLDAPVYRSSHVLPTAPSFIWQAVIEALEGILFWWNYFFSLSTPFFHIVIFYNRVTKELRISWRAASPLKHATVCQIVTSHVDV